MKWLIVAFCLVTLFSTILSLKCAPTACDTVQCQSLSECGPREIKSKGGWCLCCDVCKKIIGENKNCASGSPIGGVISDKVVCDKGLICHNDVCQKEEDVIGSS